MKSDGPARNKSECRRHRSNTQGNEEGQEQTVNQTAMRGEKRNPIVEANAIRDQMWITPVAADRK